MPFRNDIMKLLIERRHDILEDIQRTAQRLNEYHVELEEVNQAIAEVKEADEMI